MSGKLTLISSATASGSASVEFTSGLDSTYDEYVFYFVNINPATNNVTFGFQGNATDSTGYDRTITSTFFVAGHEEGDSSFLTYVVSADQAQGTAYQQLAYNVGNGADESLSGVLHLFNPSNTTYIKHFYSRVNFHQENNTSTDGYAAGYINDTTAIDDIQFKMSSGNFDGSIHFFGVG